MNDVKLGIDKENPIVSHKNYLVWEMITDEKEFAELYMFANFKTGDIFFFKINKQLMPNDLIEMINARLVHTNS